MFRDIQYASKGSIKNALKELRLKQWEKLAPRDWTENAGVES